MRLTAAFSLVTVMFIILLMATLFIAIVNLSGKTLHETSSQYHHEQASLLARSYTEYAIMTIMSNNRKKTKHCISNISAVVGGKKALKQGNAYYVYVYISFIGQNQEIDTCFKSRQLANIPQNALHTLIDVYVRYKDITHPQYDESKSSTTLWINYHKRTLQKI